MSILAVPTGSPPPDVTPFRAGRAEGEEISGPPGLAVFSGAPHVRAADVSEFQRNIHDDIYVKNFSQAVIIRVAYGSHHDDKAWFGGDRRKQFHDNGIRYLGMYQYVVAGQDITEQAKAFCRLVKAMRPGEDLFADIEEGGGNQAGRRNTWAHVVQDSLGWAPREYSGRFFARDHGLQPVDWVASYTTTEPPEPHMWWQFTDALSIPGIGPSDCSVFHGSMDDLVARAYGGKKPQPKDWTQEAIMALPTLGAGDQDHPGATRYVHRIQIDVAGIGRWNNLGPVTAVKDDGHFGPTTTAAVKAVQKFFGLRQDGVVGQTTWKKLIGV